MSNLIPFGDNYINPDKVITVSLVDDKHLPEVHIVLEGCVVKVTFKDRQTAQDALHELGFAVNEANEVKKRTEYRAYALEQEKLRLREVALNKGFIDK